MYIPKFDNEEEKNNFWMAVKDYENKVGGINKLASKYGVGNKLRYYLQKNNLTTPKHRTDIQHDFFKSIDTEDKAYWLGFIFADGYVSDWTNTKNHKYTLEITLKSEDRGHLEKFKECIGYTGDITDRLIKGKYSASRLSINSKELVLDLNNLGCTPRKSLTLEYPVQHIPKNLHKHFIRGYFDGDGSVNSYKSKQSNRPKINISIVGTEHMLSNIQSILCSELDILKSELYGKCDRNVFEYKKAWKIALKILHYLYDDSNIYLDRKHKFFQDYCRLWGM